MKVLVPGHKYKLTHLDGDNHSILSFVNRNRGQEEEGTNCQEVIKSLIDRVKFLDNQLHWEQNKDIIHHLRMALVLFEARALIRKVEKNELKIENFVEDDKDGHLLLNLWEEHNVY